MLRSSMVRVAVVLGSVLLLGSANFPDALCGLIHWPSC